EMISQGPDDQTRTVGSWEGREIYRSPDGQIQMFEHWARDAKKVATPMHVHEKSHVWATVLSGKVRVQTETEEHALGPHDSIHFPPETSHSTTPLTRTTRVVLVLSPAEDAWA
ncbi:MAG: cupin domain-containing protein, partial [Candidatus Bipolaricaulota bacterium]